MLQQVEKQSSTDSVAPKNSHEAVNGDFKLDYSEDQLKLLAERIMSFVCNSEITVNRHCSQEYELETLFLLWMRENIYNNYNNVINYENMRVLPTRAVLLKPERVSNATTLFKNLFEDQDNFQREIISVCKERFRLDIQPVDLYGLYNTPSNGQIFARLRLQIDSKRAVDLENMFIWLLLKFLVLLNNNSDTVMLQLYEWFKEHLYKFEFSKDRLRHIEEDLKCRQYGRNFSLLEGPITYQENFLGVLGYLHEVEENLDCHPLYDGLDFNRIIREVHQIYLNFFPPELFYDGVPMRGTIHPKVK